jgi:PAS domain S-box-containing protein
MYRFVCAELMVGAVIVAIAILHLILAWHGVRRNLNFLFAVLSFFAAGEGLCAPVRYLSSTIPGAILGVKLSQGFIIAFGAAAIWFTREYVGFRGWRIPAAITGIALVILAFHIALPYSLRFDVVTGLKTSELPGGGVMFTPVGRNHPWATIAELFGVSCFLYVIAACIKLWRNPADRGKAIAFTVGVVPVALFAYPQGELVIQGVVDPPQYYAFAYLALVGVMSYRQVQDALRSISLSREIRTNEQRWRSLLESVSLLVLGCDREGRIEYCNPFLAQVSGYGAAELSGQKLALLFRPGDAALLDGVLRASMSGDPPTQVQTGFLPRSKQERTVLWSNVALRNSEDEVTGTLSVGVDITQRVSAEKARDTAIAQLAALKGELEAENQYLRLEFEGSVDTGDFVGKSAALRDVLHKISQVAATSTTVLIEGETGVGKELVARAIHKASPRSQMPFVRVNCAALTANLIENELFGEAHAQPDADRPRPGRFQLAEGGTLLLDEIGELPFEAQAKVLRVLRDGDLDRVGEASSRKANVRIIASTTRDLRQEVATGRFREDLYHRLHVFSINVPSLRERRDDIPLLVHYFLHVMSQKHGKPAPEIAPDVIYQLVEREWPGNVGELENVVERAVITSTGPSLTLPDDLGRNGEGAGSGASAELVTLDAVERHHIELILKRTGGQIVGEGGAAQVLGLHPNVLRGRMAKLGLERLKR